MNQEERKNLAFTMEDIDNLNFENLSLNDNNHAATIIQKAYKKKLETKNINNYLHIIINTINKNNDKLNDMFIKCLKIYKKYPPSKNDYKFIYGGLIQKAVIDLFTLIFHKCIDLDGMHDYGSEYKNDCSLYLTNYINFNISIKAKSKKTGDIILINKLNNNIKHELKGLITVVLIIETLELIIIPHNIVDCKYIKNDEATIKYKSSLITYLRKSRREFIVSLIKNKNFEDFMNNEYNTILPVNLYKELYDKL